MFIIINHWKLITVIESARFHVISLYTNKLESLFE